MCQTAKLAVNQRQKLVKHPTIAICIIFKKFCYVAYRSKHFRGGVWKQWIFWTQPGPTALAAVQRVEAEVNQARAAATLPLLVFDPAEPLVISVIEENNPRGPDGRNLANPLPNQEIFFATFAEVETGGE